MLKVREWEIERLRVWEIDLVAISRVVMKSIILGIHSKNDPYILELTKINNFHNGNFSPRGLFNRPTASFLGYRVIFRW